LNNISNVQLKVLALVVVGAATKSALSLLDTADGWGDAILAFNGALAGLGRNKEAAALENRAKKIRG
jgi:hypothetical protein